jgi:hypothetical protein
MLNISSLNLKKKTEKLACCPLFSGLQWACTEQSSSYPVRPKFVYGQFQQGPLLMQAFIFERVRQVLPALKYHHKLHRQGHPFLHQLRRGSSCGELLCRT